MLKLRFLLCSLFVFPFCAKADLVWSNANQTLSAGPNQKLVQAKYPFTNKGDKPVTISGVKTSCGCTTAALKKMAYAPGESGEIDVTFHVEGRTGRQEKTIMINTVDAPNRPTFLQLTVNIPEVLVIQPQFVFWRVGDKPEPKTMHITVGDGFPAKIVSVEPDAPEVNVQTKEIKPGKELDVQITPKDLKGPNATTILIKTDYPPDNPQTHYAYVRVK